MKPKFYCATMPKQLSHVSYKHCTAHCTNPAPELINTLHFRKLLSQTMTQLHDFIEIVERISTSVFVDLHENLEKFLLVYTYMARTTRHAKRDSRDNLTIWQTIQRRNSHAKSPLPSRLSDLTTAFTLQANSETALSSSSEATVSPS